MPRFSHVLFLLYVAGFLFACAPQSQAARRGGGLRLITAGSTISEVGTVLATTPATPTGLNHVGFRYSYFGLFWLDLWNWGGMYVLYDGTTSMLGRETVKVVEAEEAARLLGGRHRLSKPLNYRIPYGLAIILGGISLKLYLRRRAAARNPKIQEFTPPPIPATAPPQFSAPPPPLPGVPSPAAPEMDDNALPPPLPAPALRAPPPLPPPSGPLPL